MILLAITGWTEAAGIFLGGGVVATIAGALIQWWRFKKKDISETEKVEAETQKLRMEAYQIKAEAEVTISEAALKLVQRITEECNEIRKNVDRLEEQLVLINKELRAEREKNSKLLAEISLLKKGK